MALFNPLESYQTGKVFFVRLFLDKETSFVEKIAVQKAYVQRLAVQDVPTWVVLARTDGEPDYLFFKTADELFETFEEAKEAAIEKALEFGNEVGNEMEAVRKKMDALRSAIETLRRQQA